LIRHLRFTGFWCLLLGCLAAAGCNSSTGTPPPADEETPTSKNLDRIGDAYQRANIRLNHPPANLDDLLQDLREQGKPDELLRSPNDGEKYEIVWGVELRRLKAQGNDVPVVAYEKRGKDGRRYVLRGAHDIKICSESQLKGAKFPPGYVFPF